MLEGWRNQHHLYAAAAKHELEFGHEETLEPPYREASQELSGGTSLVVQWLTL